ncbi:hypothetical protein GGF42_006587, partial [Coemansia sp. RSA 2424]
HRVGGVDRRAVQQPGDRPRVQVAAGLCRAAVFLSAQQRWEWRRRKPVRPGYPGGAPKRQRAAGGHCAARRPVLETVWQRIAPSANCL